MFGVVFNPSNFNIMLYKNKMAALLVVAVLLGSTSYALAEGATSTSSTSTTATTTPNPTPVPPSPPAIDKRDYKLEVGPHGWMLLRGNIEAVSSSTLKVRSWGGVWTVNLVSGAEVIPHETGSRNIREWAVGDYVGVQGTVVSSADWTVDGKVVRNWTNRRRLQEEAKSIREEVKDKFKDAENNLKQARKEAEEKVKDTLKGMPRNYEGTAGVASGGSFTFTDERGVTYVVTISSSTKLVNNNWLPIALGGITVGDKVRVFGGVSSSTLAAEVIRDVSLPLRANHDN